MILAHQNIHFLDQGIELLAALDDHSYCACDSHGHSCVGAHLRHVLDCYRCFLKGWESGRIDYDARQRNPAVETDRRVAEETIREIRNGLVALRSADRNRRVEVRVDAAAWSDTDPWTQSTLGRELQFLLSHTVHHYALIAMTLRGIGFEPGRRFGVAPSTLEFQDHEAQPTGAAAACHS